MEQIGFYEEIYSFKDKVIQSKRKYSISVSIKCSVSYDQIYYDHWWGCMKASFCKAIASYIYPLVLSLENISFVLIPSNICTTSIKINLTPSVSFVIIHVAT